MSLVHRAIRTTLQVIVASCAEPLCRISERVQNYGSIQSRRCERAFNGRYFRWSAAVIERCPRNMLVADVDECLSSPCLRNAPCVDEYNRFKCLCPQHHQPGKFYVGQRCELGTSHMVSVIFRHSCDLILNLRAAASSFCNEEECRRFKINLLIIQKKTVHSLANVVYAKALKQPKLK